MRISRGEITALVFTLITGVFFGVSIGLLGAQMLPESKPVVTKAKITAKPKSATKPKPTVKPKPRVTKTSRSYIRPPSFYRYATKVNTPSKRYAQSLVSARQFVCLHELWMRESGWSPTSDNPTSSAYGIPQILGLEERTGDDARAQVRAGLAYISHRYGTPCRAMAFWSTHRWY